MFTNGNESHVHCSCRPVPLGRVFDQLPGVTVADLERIIPARDVLIPYFWVRGTVVDDMAGVFDDHPGVKQIELVDSVADEYLLRVAWEPSHDDVLSILSESDIAVIEATGTAEHWTFDIRGESRSDIAAFQSRCQEAGVPITLTGLHALTPVETGTEAVLTDPQMEALVLAYRSGYYESPREVTLANLGEDLGISPQAVASRLRRGIKHILGHTLSNVPPSERPTK